MSESPEEIVEVPVPTDDNTPDGTQLSTDEDLDDEVGDAGVGDADLDPSVFEED